MSKLSSGLRRATRSVRGGFNDLRGRVMGTRDNAPPLLTEGGRGSGTNFQALIDAMSSGGTPEDGLLSILRNFRGDPSNLDDFMRRAGPLLASAEAGRLRRSPAMQHLENQDNWDLGATAAYGAGAGMIGKQGRRATDAAMQRLSASGLGRGSARSALQQQGMQNTAGQQAQLWSQTFQQAQQNRWNSAAGLLDAHRALSQMALGQMVTPRMPGGDGGGGMSQDLQTGVAIAGGLGGLMAGAGALML